MTTGDERTLHDRAAAADSLVLTAGEDGVSPLDKLDLISKRLLEVASSGRRTRHLALGLAVSIVLDVALTVVVTLLSVSALDQGATLRASQLSACAMGDQSRAEQIRLWDYVFQLSGGAKTDQQKEFLVFVEKTFAPVNCAQLYK